MRRFGLIFALFLAISTASAVEPTDAQVLSLTPEVGVGRTVSILKSRTTTSLILPIPVLGFVELPVEIWNCAIWSALPPPAPAGARGPRDHRATLALGGVVVLRNDFAPTAAQPKTMSNHRNHRGDGRERIWEECIERSGFSLDSLILPWEILTETIGEVAMLETLQLMALTDAELERFDLVEMNLLIAKGLPALADLDIAKYRSKADEWANAVREQLPEVEREFHKTPQDWKNDLDFYRLGFLCGFLEHQIGIEYREDQREAKKVRYTNPSELFLNGLMDTLRGDCANMATLHVAIGRRLGWPVSLACVGSHYICRYDDGRKTHNIEATQSGYGGFKSDPDDYLIEKYPLPPCAIQSGSDLTALSARQMLGVFLGFRARHLQDTRQWTESERDYLLARHQFPNNRKLYMSGLGVSFIRGTTLFEESEKGGPTSFADGIYIEYRHPYQTVHEWSSPRIATLDGSIASPFYRGH